MAFNASETGEYGPDLYTMYIENWLDEIDSSGENDPFFLVISHQSPHTPVEVKQDYIRVIRQNANITKGFRKNYCSLVYSMDASISSTISKLESLNMWDNTLLIFFSDNGNAQVIGSSYPLRGIKGTFFEGGIRTPAIVSGGILPAAMEGTVLSDSVSLVDLFGTICTFAGVDCSDISLDGIDLYDYITGASSSLSRDYLLLNVNYLNCDATYTSSSTSETNTVCGGIRYGDLKVCMYDL